MAETMRDQLHGIEPFDPSSSFDVACERYRKKLLGTVLRALDKNGDEGLLAVVSGSLVAIAQALHAGGAGHDEIVAGMKLQVEYAAAMAMGEITPEVATRFGQLGGRQ